MRVLTLFVLVVVLSACGGTSPEPTAQSQPVLEPAVEMSPSSPPATEGPYPVPDSQVAIDEPYPPQQQPTEYPYPAAINPEQSMSSSTPSGRSIPLTSGALGPLLEAIALDLSTAEGIAVTDVQFQSAEAVVWPDGGLGCPDPDMIYPQVLTEGTLIMVQAGDLVTAYHTDGLNRFVRCDDGRRVSEGAVLRR